MGKGNGGGNNGGGGGGNGGGNGGGGGGNGGKGGKGKGNNLKQYLKGLPDGLLEMARALASLEHNETIQAEKRDVKQAKAHRPVVDRAYDAYGQRLAELSAAQAAQASRAQSAAQGLFGATEATAAAVTQQGMNDAAQRAAMLGQGGGNVANVAALGGSSAQSRQGLAATQVQAGADIGLAQYSDLNRRGATGERDRIRAQKDLTNLIREQKDEVKSAKKDKKAEMIAQIERLLAERFERKIARKGLSLQEQEMMLAYDIDKSQLALDRRALAIDDANADADRAAEQNGGGGGGGGGGPAGTGENINGPLQGLSSSQREEWHDNVQQVKAAQAIIEKKLDNGSSMADAVKAASKSVSGDWAIRIARYLANHGKLDKSMKALLRSHLPGDGLPEDWR